MSKNDTSIQEDAESQIDSKALLEWEKKKRITYLGIAFCILFIAYGLNQNFLTTLNKEIAFISLAIIYIVMGCFGIFVPQLSRFLGLRLSFIAAAVTYILWIFSLATHQKWLIMMASVLLGFGGALLWIAQGVYVTLISGGEKVGTYTGLFAVVFNANLTVGTIAVSILVKLNFDLQLLPLVFGCVGIIGVILLFFVRIPTMPEQKQLNTEDGVLKTAWNNVVQCGYRAIDSKMMMLYCGIIFQGTSSSFTIGLLPIFLHPNMVSYYFFCFGCSRMMASYICGVLYDRFGWRPLVICQCIFILTGYGLIYWGITHQITALFFIYGVLLGISDAIINTLINSTIMRLFTENSAPSFAVFRTINSIAWGIALFLSSFLNFWNLLLFNAFLIVSCTVSFFVLYNVILPKESSYRLLTDEQLQDIAIEQQEEKKDNDTNIPKRRADGQEEDSIESI